MLKPENFSETLAALLRKCEIEFTGKYPILVHAPDHTTADLIHSRLWEFAVPRADGITILVDGDTAYDHLFYAHYNAAYSDHVAPMAQYITHEAIAPYLPDTFVTDLEECEIFIHDGWLHIRSNGSVFDLLFKWDWYGPALRALGCNKLLFVGKGRKCANYAPHGELWTLEAIEEMAPRAFERRKAELLLSDLLESLPDTVKAALGDVGVCHCGYRPTTLDIVFTDGEGWPEDSKKWLVEESGLKPLSSVLSALPWLADADQFGFTQVELTHLHQPGKRQHHQTITISELQQQRRANLARLLGEV